MQQNLEHQAAASDSAPAPRRRLHARARSVVLTALGLFILVQIGLRCYIDGFRPELRDPTFEIKYHIWTELKNRTNPPATSVVFMGSSMTAFGIDVKVIDEPVSQVLGRPAVGYNLAIAASGPFSQLLFLERLLRRDAKPDYVVLELAAITFSHNDPFNEALHFPGPMLDRADLPTVTRYMPVPREVRRSWIEAFAVPIHGHRLTILNQTAQAFVPYKDRLELWGDSDDHGSVRMPAATSAEHAATLERITQTLGQQLPHYQIGARPLRALRELTALLAKERISTILVWMPEGPLMRSFYPSGPIQELRDEFAKLSGQHDFPLVDARCWMSEADFADSLHLTRVGRVAFTQRLVDEAILPWLKGKAAQD